MCCARTPSMCAARSPDGRPFRARSRATDRLAFDDHVIAERDMKLFAGALAGVAVLASVTFASAQEGLAKIKTIVVIYAENRSFDHLYGLFPGANGLANATIEQTTQLDHDGKPLPYVVVFGPDGKPNPTFKQMPNAPFRIDAPPIDIGLDKIAPSPVHAFYQNQEQINGGKNNKFVALSDVGGWV